MGSLIVRPISYDWRGMPVEFTRNNICFDICEQTVCGSMKLLMAYDGAGRRISKTSLRKNVNSDDWTLEQITHYTGIGSEIRKEYHNGELQSTKVVVNMPQGLGRYGIENADGMAKGDEFYLKNHLGSTMMVAQVSSTNASEPAKVAAAYDYRAFGEQVSLAESADKVTENFTGKERDDETQLNYFGARYLDPMLGMWISVDAARQYQNPYLYAGNNPIMRTDPDGNQDDLGSQVLGMFMRNLEYNTGEALKQTAEELPGEVWRLSKDMVAVGATFDPEPESRVALTLLYGGMNLAEGIYKKDPVTAIVGVAGAAASLKGPESLAGRVGVNLSIDLVTQEARLIQSTHMKDDGPTRMLPTSGPAPADRTNTSIPYFEE